MQLKRLDRRVIYRSPWVNLFVDRVEFPSGRIVEEHHLLDFDKQSVAVVVENDRDELLFVRAYRYTTASAEWEIPAGRIEPGEDAIEGAIREVLEESGYQTRGHELFYSYYPMYGIANQVFYLVRCRAAERTGEFDRDEVADVAWFTREEALEMIRKGTMKDGYTLTGLLLHFQGVV
jgi:ADP-ribose pyrophosphatase